MQNVMGIINLNEKDELLKEITANRPVAAVPFGGRYRIIDFALSNMVNSGIRNVGILVQNKYRSVMDHLRSGKEWDLMRKKGGLFILPPATNFSAGICQGDVENFINNMDYITNSRQKYVLISGSSVICNLNYRKAFKFHLDTQADVTILYQDEADEQLDCTHCITIATGEGSRVVGMKVNPGKNGSSKISMGMYILAKDLLIDLVKACSSQGGTDIVRDGFVNNIDKLKVYGYQYKGYLARINSIQDFYKHNMNLLKPENWQELFAKSGLVYTKVKDEAPVKYKEGSKVVNTMIANGCIIAGHIENSIIFRGVTIGKGSHIRDSVIMQKCEIAEDAIVENVICDKDVRINAGKWVKGERNYPLVIKKGTVI